MRLNEIDSQDRLWAAMVKLDLNIDNKVFKVIDQLKILVKMQNPAFNKLWLPKIDQTSHTLNIILNANFANDRSTAELKAKARHYLHEIETLRDQL